MYQPASTDLPLKSATFLIHEIKTNWHKLSPEAQNLLSPYFQRPDLPNNMLSASGKFRIHYATEGPDKVNDEDQNKNSIPDYIEAAASYFDHSHQVIIDELGYKPPAADSSGNGKEFDIYVINLYKTYGITQLEETVPGRANAWSCYIEVDNDFIATEFKLEPLQELMVTAAHEYFHAVQVNYYYRDDDVFFMEMCSTWMEDFIYDEVNDYLNYVKYFFADNEYSYPNYNYPFYYTNSNWFEYASCLWIHMIVKKYEPNFVRKVWESIPKEKAFSAIQQMLLKYNTTFNEELASFGLWNYFTGSRANLTSYYSEGKLYPEIQFDKELSIQEETLNLTYKMRKLSSIYYRVYDEIHGNDIGLIVTNLAIPNENYMTNDLDSFKIIIGSISDVQKSDSTFFLKNNFVKLTDNIGIKLSVKEGKNWLAQAVITDINFNNEIIQFFPPFFIYEPEHRNFINNIYPNPFIIDHQEPLFINYVVSDEKPGEIAIYTAEGRLIIKDDFEDSSQSYYIFNWDGRNESGDLVSSGVYIVLLRVGGSVDIKKLAIVRK